MHMRWLFFLALLLYAAGACAQVRTITGTVRDAQGNPVPFASVTEAGTRNTVSADANGNFSIRVGPNTSRLVISATGFKPLTIAFSGTTASAVLERAGNNQLETVVVTSGLGVERRSREMGYAATAVQGRVAGLNVTTDGGGGGDEDKKLKTWKRSGLGENSVKLTVGDKDTLRLRAAQVAVQVDGFRARVLFDFYFLNDRGSRLRGNFRLKLPAGASPCYFAFGGVELLNRDKRGPVAPVIPYALNAPLNLLKDSLRPSRRGLREARVVPKAKAAYAFNETVRGNVDPALAEWAGADVFSCSVFPLEAGKMQHLVIGYDINLLQSGTEALLELNLPFPNVRRSVDVSVAEAGAGKVELSPALPERIRDGYRRYHTDAFTETALTMNIRTLASVLLESAGNEPSFAVTATAALDAQAVASTESAVFLLDVSWSSQPDKFNIWLKTLEAVLRGNRRQIKKFAVLCFHVDAFWWRRGFVANTEHNLQSFLRYAGKLSLVGATDLGRALRESAHPAWETAPAPAARSLFLLSDGDASWGDQNLYLLSQSLRPQDRLYAFVTGLSGTDTRVLHHLSRESGGAVFSVLNEEELAEAARAIRYAPWYIESVSAGGCRDLLLAGRPNALFPGQKLLVTGRGRPVSGTVEIRLRRGDEVRTLQVVPEARLASSLAHRVFGQVAVQQLSAFGFATRTAADRFAAWYDVPDEDHSFVMLESEALYRRFGIDSASFRAFVDSSEVSRIVARVLAEAARSGSLGSARAVFNDWLRQLRADNLRPIADDGLLAKALAALPDSVFEVPVGALHGRNLLRRQWMARSLQAIDGQPEYARLLKQVRAEQQAAGAADAFTLLSTMAESNRDDLALLRDLAFELERWRLSGQAYQLLAQLLRARPAEPATWGLLAANLRQLNRPALAVAYYDIAFHTNWDRRFDGFDLILALDYYRLLIDPRTAASSSLPADFLEARRSELKNFLASRGVQAAEADLMVVITWNTDNTDVDLHLREPSGEECYYSHRKTASGGFLSNDATDGFGPEMYYLEKAPAGSYRIDVDYYGDSRVQTAATSKILVHAYKNWGRPNEERFEKVVELRKKKAARPGNRDDDEVEKTFRDVLVIDF
ncbi:MAG: VWA domain-containing protein [Chitinophagaceae bacterium]|nr:MAG: VWA domain-containing protein [Chitinophagaceae bacterium]